MKNLLLKFLLILVLIPTILYASSALYTGFHVYQQPTHQADAVIVLGARTYFGNKINPCLAARLDQGARLVKKHQAEYIIVSGGSEPNGKTEADMMAELLTHSGVSQERIIRESKSTSTYENLLFSQKILDRKNFKSVIIVSEPFHIPRAHLVASQLGITHEMASADTSPCWTRWKWASRYFLREPAVIILYKLQGKI